MIRYLSCGHENGEDWLTEEELKLFKVGKGCIVTENNQTRFEEVHIDIGWTDYKHFALR